MRKSTWKPQAMSLRQMGSPFGVHVFLLKEDGIPALRIDNAGPFNREQALKLARFILQSFADPAPRTHD